MTDINKNNFIDTFGEIKKFRYQKINKYSLIRQIE